MQKNARALALFLTRGMVEADGHGGATVATAVRRR